MMFRFMDILQSVEAEDLKNELREWERFNISTDTRTIKAGDVYLPLKGASFDGENFIDKALETGAMGYFTTRNEIKDKAKIIFGVKDTLQAYLSLAKFQRLRLNPITIAVTGSSGKTTTKEIIYSVVRQQFKTHKTFSNHNNEIGFCQTVLSMPADTEVLIVEMGMRGLGEIELISTHLNPDFAVITNSGSAHVGRLGNLDNIAKAKCEIASGLKPNGVFFAKKQDIIKKHLNFEGEKIYYTLDDVEILEKSQAYTKFKYKNEIYELNVEGDYNIENSLAAIEIGLKLNMDIESIKQGLLAYRPIEKRWETEEVNSLKFINDSYNANPESMKASVKTFIELYPNPVVILGDMGELGENEKQYHREVGEYFSKISNNKNVKFITVGKLALEIAQELEKSDFEVYKFDNNEDTARYIVENLNGDYTIFLKASRSMKFEQILENVKRGIVKL